MRAFALLVAVVLGCSSGSKPATSEPALAGGSSQGGAAGGTSEAGAGGAGAFGDGGTGDSAGATVGGEAGGSSGEAAGGTGGELGGGNSGGGAGSPTYRCDYISECKNVAEDCGAALSAPCQSCRYGSYSCGAKVGFHTDDGKVFPCAAADCAAAAAAARRHCGC